MAKFELSFRLNSVNASDLIISNPVSETDPLSYRKSITCEAGCRVKFYGAALPVRSHGIDVGDGRVRGDAGHDAILAAVVLLFPRLSRIALLSRGRLDSTLLFTLAPMTLIVKFASKQATIA